MAGVLRLVVTACGIYGDIYLGRFQNPEIGCTIPNNWGSDASGSQFFHGSQNLGSFVSKFTVSPQFRLRKNFNLILKVRIHEVKPLYNSVIQKVN
jgi:hypothetical protein